MSIKRFFIEGYDFIFQLYSNRGIIWELTKRDFKTKYVSNIFGLSWAIIEPLAMMIVLWFIFTFVRTGRSMEVPFSLYLLSGLIAYDFFNKCLNSGTNAINSFGFLITKVNFRSAIIPLVKIASEMLLHFIILVLVMIIFIANGIEVSIYWIQVIYYLFASAVLLTGITWFTSSISLFFPDIKYIITITMRVLFFFTPIFWSADSIPVEYRGYFRINPLYYIVNGYRDSFLYHEAFWEHPIDTLYFWILVIFFLTLGVIVFKRLRPLFADII